MNRGLAMPKGRFEAALIAGATGRQIFTTVILAGSFCALTACSFALYQFPLFSKSLIEGLSAGGVKE